MSCRPNFSVATADAALPSKKRKASSPETLPAAFDARGVLASILALCDGPEAHPNNSNRPSASDG